MYHACAAYIVCYPAYADSRDIWSQRRPLGRRCHHARGFLQTPDADAPDALHISDPWDGIATHLSCSGLGIFPSRQCVPQHGRV